MARHYVPSLADTKSVSPMGKDLCDIFLKCSLAELSDPAKEREFTEAEAKSFPPFGSLLLKRMALYGMMNPPRVGMGAAIIALMQCRTQADTVMWAFCLNRIYQQAGFVSLAHLAEVFPEGFPNEAGKLEVWDAQKAKNWGEDRDDMLDNLLDRPDMLTDTINTEEQKEWCKWLKT